MPFIVQTMQCGVDLRTPYDSRADGCANEGAGGGCVHRTHGRVQRVHFAFCMKRKNLFYTVFMLCGAHRAHRFDDF